MLSVLSPTYAAASALVDQESNALQFAVDHPGEEWQRDEVEALLGFINTLPSSLHPTVLVGPAGTPLQFFKNRTAEGAVSVVGMAVSEQLKQQLLTLLLQRYDETHCVSCSSEWRALSGWEPKLLGLMLAARNQDPRAYATAAGLDSPRNDFVTFAHHYLLPPDSTMEASIKCRAPHKFAFVRELFTGYESPLDSVGNRCREVDDGLLDDVLFYDPISGQPLAIGPINMATVTGFELLYATPGTGDASEIAGHLLLRIKLDNNPAAIQAGVENPHDLVISFLANTQDTLPAQAPAKTQGEQHKKLQCQANWLNIVDDGRHDFDALQSVFQSLKGLSGGFLTMMNRQTLAEALKTYTLEEDRNLLRYELLLNEDQKYSLLQRLHLAKKNYNSSYYFFNQNCASVLVKVMGEGVGSREIAEFDPLVSPPNSLVAMFIREGLARPVYPSFYSYRKRGYLAQELIKPLYSELTHNYAALQWPAIDDLFSKSEARRVAVAEAVFRLAWQISNDDEKSYRLANLIQESEMVFAHKDLNCENYTSLVTAKARQFQRQWLAQHDQRLSVDYVDLNTTMNELYMGREAAAYQQGTPYTQLFSSGVGYGVYRRQESSRPVLNMGIAMAAQEMGALSSVAMQRGNFVKLGAVDLALALDGNGRGDIQTWQVTALRIRKLKERLEYIPHYFSPAGAIGLGLGFLDLYGDKTQDYRRVTLIGGELLFNLVSSLENNDYLLMGMGSEWVSQKGPIHSATSVMLPLHLEALMTYGKVRQWQWRSSLDYRLAMNTNMADEAVFRTSLAYRLETAAAPQLLLKLSADYNNVAYPNGASLIAPWWKVVLGVEVNHW